MNIFWLGHLSFKKLYSYAPIKIYHNTSIWCTFLTPLSTSSFPPARPLVSAIKVAGKRFWRKTFQADVAAKRFPAWPGGLALLMQVGLWGQFVKFVVGFQFHIFNVKLGTHLNMWRQTLKKLWPRMIVKPFSWFNIDSLPLIFHEPAKRDGRWPTESSINNLLLSRCCWSSRKFQRNESRKKTSWLLI